jgi:hypothetical protein
MKAKNRIFLFLLLLLLMAGCMKDSNLHDFHRLAVNKLSSFGFQTRKLPGTGILNPPALKPPDCKSGGARSDLSDKMNKK